MKIKNIVNCKLDRGICSHQFGNSFMTGCSSLKKCKHQLSKKTTIKSLKYKEN